MGMKGGADHLDEEFEKILIQAANKAVRQWRATKLNCLTRLDRALTAKGGRLKPNAPLPKEE
jgi:hypothetical protein